ncbi:hypothetical protein [Hymenobacter sp. CRA2]|uniref:hypothetical protein n=1 Tax=Hymenobacter sp. CRA2 TaxID=1955620 RepID=UPI00098E93EC|nr:hypothetical protein [Hymenobacter sp. CRA2]OON67129.1 hypothetical protein B0919_20090 [Hymenobacter sp. CRA2]
MTPRVKNLVRLALATALILLVPAVAMQFSQEVNWTAFDFIFAGAMIFGTGLAYELVVNGKGSLAYRLGVGAALAAAFLLVMVNGAVGIIGSEHNPVNLLFATVLLIVIVGAAMARLRPLGMARTMVVAALAQLLVPAVGLLIWHMDFTADVRKGLVANLLFVGLWAGAAVLFRRANGSSPGSSPMVSHAA